LVPIWYPFGALLLILGYLFGAISWPLRRLGIPKTLLEFHRPSSYSIKFFLFPKLMRVGHDVGKGGGGRRIIGRAAPGPFVFRRSFVCQIWDNFSARPATFCALFSVFFTIEVREAEAFSQPVDPSGIGGLNVFYQPMQYFIFNSKIASGS